MPTQIARFATGLRIAMVTVALSTSPLVAQDAGSAPKVSVAAAYSEDLIDEVTFIGRGEAIDKVDIIARVSGFLKEQSIEDGQTVEAGQQLFLIEPDAYEATVDARTADLTRAEASLELARIELDRKSQLVAREASPQSEEDIARANEKVAEAEVAAAKAAIRAAELDLSYTQVNAPFSGRVGRVERSVGDLVGPTTAPLVNLVREQPMRVAFSLSEKQFIDVMETVDAEVHNFASNERMPQVFITLPNGRRMEEPGNIVFVDNRIDPTTGTIALRAEFANENGFIVDGSFVDVTVQAIEAVTKLLVPQAAVQRDQRGDFVLVVKADQTVEQRYITLGDQFDASVVVTEHLRDGEMVIVEGLQRVRPGVAVDPVVAGASTEPAGE